MRLRRVCCKRRRVLTLRQSSAALPCRIRKRPPFGDLFQQTRVDLAGMFFGIADSFAGVCGNYPQTAKPLFGGSLFRTVFFPHTVDGDHHVESNCEQGRVPQHDITLLNNRQKADTGDQPAGQQEGSGKNEELQALGNFFGFPNLHPTIGEVVHRLHPPAQRAGL